MRTMVSPQRALTAALIAAAVAALGCSDSGPLTAPARLTSGVSAQTKQTPASPAIIDARGPSRSGYALASGRLADSLAAPAGK
jgi:hypothetical protein